MQVVFTPKAEADLLQLYDFIAAKGGSDRAWDYAERIRATCLRLVNLPERGARRDDIRPGLRVLGFERRVAIAFHTSGDRVIIDRILYGGRDLDALLGG